MKPAPNRDQGHATVSQRSGQTHMTGPRTIRRDETGSGLRGWLGSDLGARLSDDPALLEHICGGLFDGLWVWNLEARGDLSPGRDLKARLGYADHEIEDSIEGWQSLIHPDDVATVTAGLNRLIADPTADREQTIRYRDRNGATAWMRCRTTLLRNAMGQPIRMIATHIDISDLKRAEADQQNRLQDMSAQIVELRDQEERLERQAEELVTLAENLEEARAHQEELNAQKDRFFSIVAHDMKSPFNPLLGFSEILASSATQLPPEKVAEYGALLHRAATEAFKLLEDLLDWSRIQLDRVEFDPGALDLGALVQRNINRYYYAAQAKDVSLRTEGLAEPLFAYADPRMLDTVLRNLISNAIKFTRGGDTITVIAGAHEDDSPMPRVRLSVRDTGVGIPADVLPTLLALDSKTSATGTHGEKGTGLGLVICRELMTRQGGSIWMESTHGQGTTAHLSLPRA